MHLSALILVALSVGAAPPADKFDLVCNGGIRFSAIDSFEPWNFRLRLDLEAGRYCEADCKVTRPIAEVQPNLIIITKQTDAEKLAGKSVYHNIDRTTGKYTHFTAYMSSSRDFMDVKADCEPAAFTGFPELKTRF